MAVVMPRSFAGMMTGLLRGALLMVPLYFLYMWLFVYRKKDSPSSWTSTGAARPIPVTDAQRQTPPQAKQAAYMQQNAGTSPGRSSRNPCLLRPETCRNVALRTRVTELAGSLSYAVLGTALIAAAVSVLSPAMQSPARIALFAAGTLIAAWTVLTTSKMYEGTHVRSGHRRLMTALAGAIVGAVIYGLHRFLLIQFAAQDSTMQNGGLLSSIGSVSLTGASQPTLAGYIVFFALLFAVRHWWRHADSLRKRRLRLSSVLLTTLVGLVLSLLFSFPMMWGVTWAAAISCVVQLSAVWVSPE